MMIQQITTIKQLVEFIKKSDVRSCFYHFTDDDNYSSIMTHGILSRDERNARGIIPNRYGGNDKGNKLDQDKNITDYVCLSFTSIHPLGHIAKKEGRLPNRIYLEISPEILLEDGVMFVKGVANARHTKLLPIAEAIQEIDLEVIYCKTNRNDPDIKNRFFSERKSEILVPKCVSKNFILGKLGKKYVEI